MSDRFARVVFVVALFGLCVGAASMAGARGYTSRACGFDMDDDGIIGEPEDCRVCDANIAFGLVSGGTPDPDGDGIDEDLIYIDCTPAGPGVDQAGCGQVGAPPCLTLQFALDQSDGAGDGAEEIFCFQATCTPENLTPANGGVPGTHTVPATGSQTRAWKFPTDPAMIVGWDVDGDGDYPPHDADDIAVMDGGAPNNLDRTFFLGLSGANDYFEMAHFTAQDYGNRNAACEPNCSNGTMGFMKPNGNSYLHVHDIETEGINKDRADLQSCGGGSAISTFNMFGIQGSMEYFAITNSSFSNYGSYWMRGAPGNTDALSAGPIRVQNSTMTAHGEDGCVRGTTLTKLWGYLNGFEFLDNVADGNVGAWDASQHGGQGVTIAQCARDFDIINNTFTEHAVAVHIQGSAAGFCNDADARTVDDIVVSGNDIQTHTNIGGSNIFSGFTAFLLTNGSNSNGETVENITYSNNTISCSADCQACLWADMQFSGPTQPGVVTFDNNVCELTDLAGSGGRAPILIFPFASTDIESYSMHNNNFIGLGANDTVQDIRYAPTNWVADNNCYDPDARFRWNNGGFTGFATWQTDSGGDANSVAVDPCPVPEPANFSVGLAAILTLSLLRSPKFRLAASRTARG